MCFVFSFLFHFFLSFVYFEIQVWALAANSIDSERVCIELVWFAKADSFFVFGRAFFCFLSASHDIPDAKQAMTYRTPSIVDLGLERRERSCMSLIDCCTIFAEIILVRQGRAGRGIKKQKFLTIFFVPSLHAASQTIIHTSSALTF